ncbi:type VI secretion system baseplate subunit TssK, partial [Escherichia coli]|nr:type VI secretion system baseplate subunit TssK [Escherichia coli]
QRSYLWGFLDLELDEAMLRQGCIALSYCSGLLPDSTFFQVRSDRNGPAPLKIPDNLTNEKVVLALPVRRGGREEVNFREEPSALPLVITVELELEDENAMAVGEAMVQF